MSETASITATFLCLSSVPSCPQAAPRWAPSPTPQPARPARPAPGGRRGRGRRARRRAGRAPAAGGRSGGHLLLSDCCWMRMIATIMEGRNPSDRLCEEKRSCERISKCCLEKECLRCDIISGLRWPTAAGSPICAEHHHSADGRC